MGVNELAEVIRDFLVFFDSLFLADKNAESLLEDVKESLIEKISRNESALAVIIALGGNYDARLDRAKIKEVDAIISLLRARREVRDATIEEMAKKEKNEAALKAFGL